MSFTRLLQDVVATQKEKVTLECELSRPVDVRWLKVLLSPLLFPVGIQEANTFSQATLVPDRSSLPFRMAWSCGQARPWA